MEPIDSTKPNIARVWDYWLGGKDNFAADRELAQKLLEVHPPSAQMARENRRFLGRAVSYVATRGISQFIDVGAGLPTALNTHDIARQANPQARVAYVDNDHCKPGCTHAPTWPGCEQRGALQRRDAWVGHSVAR